MLKGKTAVVTGASRGIGRAIALKLAEQGANIAVNYVSSEQEGLKLAQEIENLGGRALVLKADVSVFSEAEQLIAMAKAEFGTIDILVNNAGITRDGLLMRMSEDDFDRVVEVDLKGVFNCTRHAVPIMVKQKSGRIINITSVVGILGNAGQVNYAAAKAGVIGLTKSLAKEIGSRNITVNAVAPGFIETDMTSGLSDKVRELTKESIALKRFGKPENIADTVLFLASDAGEYITGQVISVDGGMAF
ncbi:MULTISPECIES: 3-oxoacyl-[acyl-carrier-protein] reductase [unclassified Dehalobacter]|uniref:3-oxoacyl-[acyl-carrier-protein] reductase n=1 Tax=unclassified Dehalobacter TaxID=2635733 RepID=UPI0003879229|nr:MULTISPECIES: 3-oxoacyl-[acyl-carrier-protein] reductase [unclassified Dehalobacter]EQB20317.1 3-oxoacyl-[acyl-carrier protein] reductase [Dehalobacter sp. UNSWDHB]RJE47584.1 3-oxoacyl-[acyl-carrier-protein] reductase [Dehalobacter sp. MCB1]TCX48603.1 3-oxoacyl-[acyl-carrier-protein] reductase [Dehalobacter sp. 14DCB1]TCX56348.1 3-oxoacyl-[acyl-carrier-protein] reductase [Dehalobacter sp. 12DCB1]